MQRKYYSFRVHCANYGKKIAELIKICKYYWLSTPKLGKYGLIS